MEVRRQEESIAFKPYKLTISVDTREEHDTLKGMSFSNCRIPDAIYHPSDGFASAIGSLKACKAFLHELFLALPALEE